MEGATSEQQFVSTSREVAGAPAMMTDDISASHVILRQPVRPATSITGALPGGPIAVHPGITTGRFQQLDRFRLDTDTEIDL
jgi:hypothetical protein